MSRPAPLRPWNDTVVLALLLPEREEQITIAQQVNIVHRHCSRGVSATKIRKVESQKHQISDLRLLHIGQMLAGDIAVPLSKHEQAIESRTRHRRRQIDLRLLQRIRINGPLGLLQARQRLANRLAVVRDGRVIGASAGRHQTEIRVPARNRRQILLQRRRPHGPLLGLPANIGKDGALNGWAGTQPTRAAEINLKLAVLEAVVASGRARETVHHTQSTRQTPMSLRAPVSNRLVVPRHSHRSRLVGIECVFSSLWSAQTRRHCQRFALANDILTRLSGTPELDKLTRAGC